MVVVSSLLENRVRCTGNQSEQATLHTYRAEPVTTNKGNQTLEKACRQAGMLGTSQQVDQTQVEHIRARQVIGRRHERTGKQEHLKLRGLEPSK